jgi:hypothetical protein
MWPNILLVVGSAVALAPVPREDVGPLLRQALESAQAITDRQEKLTTLIRIATVQNETGDAAGALKTCRAALEIARGLRDERTKLTMLATGALTQAEAGDRAAAAETMKLARRAADGMRGARQKVYAVTRLVRAQALLGDYEGALRTARESGEHQASALMFFARSLHKPDKPAARKALREAVEMMKSLPENERHQHLPDLAAAQARVGDLPSALQTVDLLDAATWKVLGLRAVAIAQAQTGDVAGALQTLKSMERAAPGGGRAGAPNQLAAGVLEAVARAQAKAGDKVGAEAMLKALRPIVDDLYAREARFAGRPGMRAPNGSGQAERLERTIAVTQYQIGDVAAARRTALGSKSELGKAGALLDVGEAAAAAGKRAEAREFLRAAAQAAETMRPGPGPGDRPRVSRKNRILWQLAQQQAKVGDVREALRTAELIDVDGEREIALESVAPAQAAAGDVQGALQTLGRLKGEAKRYALEALVEALVKAGDERGALAVVEGQKSPGLKTSALLGLAKGRAKAKAGTK